MQTQCTSRRLRSSWSAPCQRRVRYPRVSWERGGEAHASTSDGAGNPLSSQTGGPAETPVHLLRSGGSDRNHGCAVAGPPPEPPPGRSASHVRLSEGRSGRPDGHGTSSQRARPRSRPPQPDAGLPAPCDAPDRRRTARTDVAQPRRRDPWELGPRRTSAGSVEPAPSYGAHRMVCRPRARHKPARPRPAPGSGATPRPIRRPLIRARPSTASAGSYFAAVRRGARLRWNRAAL